MVQLRRRWRYYVSRAALTGRTQEAGSVVRIPASEIENRVARAVGPHLAGRASAIDGCHIDHGVRGGDQAIPQLEPTRRLRGDPPTEKDVRNAAFSFGRARGVIEGVAGALKSFRPHSS